ncbi:hypothetical protein VYH70_06315, partial [Streptococcus anginosus]|nr:hypothetical protein [Streptococcus anginosus]MED5958388.1 hypothetical protein [Streptococcus anginosus]
MSEITSPKITFMLQYTEAKAKVDAENKVIDAYNKTVTEHNKAEDARVAKEKAEAEKNRVKDGYL